jgi:hypothetical protein
MVIANQEAVKRVKTNYEKQVSAICKEMDVPSEYFLALIILECSARKNPPSRYEAHVFEKLRAVKNGKIISYSGLKKADLAQYSDQTLKLLATSWGALQIMGYNCISMNISIDELKGDNSLYYSIQWCKLNYGKYLKKRDFQNAFHIHNTGKPYPLFWFAQTHDPLYVNKGLAYANALGVQWN